MAYYQEMDMLRLREHAIAYKDKITIDDLFYLVKKSNRIGLNSGEILTISEEKDEEGTHIYFDVMRIHEDHHSR